MKSYIIKENKTVLLSELRVVKNYLPNVGSEAIEELKKSIKAIGLLEPLVVFERVETTNTYFIISGHQRFRALKELKQKFVDCVVLKIPLFKKGDLFFLQFEQERNKRHLTKSQMHTLTYLTSIYKDLMEVSRKMHHVVNKGHLEIPRTTYQKLQAIYSNCLGDPKRKWLWEELQATLDIDIVYSKYTHKEFKEQREEQVVVKKKDKLTKTPISMTEETLMRRIVKKLNETLISIDYTRENYPELNLDEISNIRDKISEILGDIK